MVEDRHVIETLGKVRVVIENGEITEVGESDMKYCPMFHAMHKVDELNEEFIRKNINFRIKDFGMCTPERIIEMDDVVTVGISEILKTNMEMGNIDCVVGACEGSVTVLMTNSRVVQFLKPDDAMALVTLKMTIKDVEGSINICVPIDSLEVLYPLFDIRGNKSKFKDEAKFEMQREMMFSSIKRSSLEIKGVLGTTELALADLLQLQKGDILILNDRPMDISPHIVIEDEKWFSADMGVHKKQYALQIKNRLK